jgi:hypothetical protein
LNFVFILFEEMHLSLMAQQVGRSTRPIDGDESAKRMHCELVNLLIPVRAELGAICDQNIKVNCD